MSRDWSQEIAKAERALARNKANIMNAPTSNGTAAFWSQPKYEIAKPIQDVAKIHIKDAKKQRKVLSKGMRHAKAREKINVSMPSKNYIKRNAGDPNLKVLLSLDLPPAPKHEIRKKRKRRKMGGGRKPRGPLYRDPRTKEI